LDGHFFTLNGGGDSLDRQRPGYSQRTRESPATFCEFQTLRPRMHVGASAFLSLVTVGNHLGPLRHDAQQVGLSGPLPTAHTGALRNGPDHHHPHPYPSHRMGIGQKESDQRSV